MRMAVLTLGALLGLGLPTWPCRADELVAAVARSTLSLPMHVADAQGFFGAEGLTVRVSDCSTGQRCMEQLFSGSAQLATASELPVMFNSFERADYAVVATLVTSTRNIQVVGRKSAGADSLAHLVGKRVGVIVRSSSHYDLDASLLFHDIDPKRLQRVPLLPEHVASAMQRKEIDAFAGYSQQVGSALKALEGDGVVLERPRIYTETFNLVVNRRMLAQREGDIVKVLRALERAQRFIASQPQRTEEILRTRLALEPGLTPAIFDGFNYRLSLDQSLVSTLEGEARWALREGHVPAGSKIPNYLDFVQPGPLRTAVPSAASVTLIR